MSKIEFETYWRGGDGATARAQALAAAASEALHTLNYATMAQGGAMDYPSHADHLVSALGSTVARMPSSTACASRPARASAPARAAKRPSGPPGMA